jgi:hypothetical protein
MADSGRSQRIEQLQEQVNQRVRDAVAGLQRELRERLRRAGDQIVGEMDREMEKGAPELPASFLSGDELAPLAQEAGSAARREVVSGLVAAFAAVDRAGSQAGILGTVLREAVRFAGRSALFLARGEGLELWGAHGWEASLEGTRLDYTDAGPWSRDSLGSGATELTTGDCGRLCSLVDAPLPQAGVLVPLVLRDRLAAVVYADHGEGEELLVEALQGLTYTAALALETLPFRERAATPTLVRRGEGGEGAGERLDVWSAAAAEAPGQEEAEELAEPEEEAAAFTEDETLDEGAFADAGAGAGETGAAAAGFALADEEEDEEDLYAGDLELDYEEEVGEETAADLGVEDLEAEGFEDEEDQEGGELETAGGGRDDEELAGYGEDLGTGYGEPGTAWEGGEEVEPLEEEPLEVEEPPSEPVERAPWSDGEVAEEEVGREPAAGFESPLGVEPPPPAAPPPELPDEVAAADDETADLAPPAAPRPLQPSPGGSEVAPPSDIQGPGRAFGGGGAAAGGDARHEEARRLARLLVSEIRLYNEEEVDEGRRNNDVYARLKEDIDRSRQMYEERVDPGIRETTDYFYQELVRNLGGGDEKALGL